MPAPTPKRLLVIRRDNIGDLVCTTPLFAALRRHFPGARVVALVNSYNAPVLAGNPDVDEVCIYRKAKHRDSGESKLAIWLSTWRLIRRLRRERFDVAIVATPGRQPAALKFAHWVRPARILAYGEASDGISDPLPLQALEGRHESESVLRLLTPLGIDEAPSPPLVRARPALAAAIATPPGDGPLIGLHISARKPPQRWPVERFIELARRLASERQARFLLFWSPGAENDPRHPGDDAKAERLLALSGELPILACPTHRLDDLIAGLSRCDAVICSDGGAMHIAAGLGKPIVCFFGNSDATRWRPRGVPHALLQPASQDVNDIGVDDAHAAFDRLMQQVGSAGA